MDNIIKLDTLMAIDRNDPLAVELKRVELHKSCKKASNEIIATITKDKEERMNKIKARMHQIEHEYAILKEIPPAMLKNQTQNSDDEF